MHVKGYMGLYWYWGYTYYVHIPYNGVYGVCTIPGVYQLVTWAQYGIQPVHGRTCTRGIYRVYTMDTPPVQPYRGRQPGWGGYLPHAHTSNTW